MAISLDTVVEDYLDSVTTALTVGPDLGSGMRGAAQNYLRAQDMSSVLELLQEALSQSTDLTATGGSTTTLEDTTAFAAVNDQVGNVVVFDAATTTVALRGVEARVASNTVTILTFEGTLPAAAAVGDLYTIRGGMFDTAIAALRQGVGTADSPPGSVYGDYRTALGALNAGIDTLGGTQPTTRTTGKIRIHPGGQPGENADLAEHIKALRAAVEASTIPVVT